MSLTIEKGGKLNLTKAAPAATYFVIGLGWNSSADLDASAVMGSQDPQGKLVTSGDKSFIFYNQKKSPLGGLEHMGDALSGKGSGDDEQIHCDLETLDQSIDRIDFFVTIYEEGKHLTFGTVTDAYIRIGTGNKSDPGKPMKEVVRYNLQNDYARDQAIQLGALTKDASGDWQFTAMGTGLGAVELGDIFSSFDPDVVKK